MTTSFQRCSAWTIRGHSLFNLFRSTKFQSFVYCGWVIQNFLKPPQSYWQPSLTKTCSCCLQGGKKTYTALKNTRITHIVQYQSCLLSFSLFRYGSAELCFHHVLLIAHLVSGVSCDLFCVLAVFWKLFWAEGPQGTLFLSYTQTELTIGVKWTWGETHLSITTFLWCLSCVLVIIVNALNCFI